MEGTPPVLLSSENSVKVTTKEPGDVESSHTREIALKLLVVREKLRVVDDCGPSLNLYK